jgi:hypothetical protein
MRVVKEDTDYIIFLTREEIEKACTKSVTSLSGLEKFYPWLYAEVEGAKGLEILALCCTRNAFYLSGPNTHDNINFEFEEVEGFKEKQPTVRIYTPTLASLLNERDYLVTRYNAESKIWIYRE